MPAIASSSKVLLTGGSGFIGSWILKELLQRGFNVRACVRTQAKAAFLRERFSDHADKLEFALVGDITAPGAFKEAIKGVSGVIHTASPMPSQNPDDDPQLHIHPALQGTLEVLKSASTSGDVKRIVVTSSAVTLFEPKPTPFTYTEDVWNEAALRVVEEKGRNAPSYSKYTASKLLAERAAWNYMQEKHSSYDLVTMLPTFIWGPIINETTSDIKGSNDYLLGPLKKSALDARTAQQNLMEIRFVDVRDLAHLHVQALLVQEAGGERIITSAHSLTWQHIFNILTEQPVDGIKVPRANPSSLGDWQPKMVMSQEKSKRILGAEYRSADETIRDLLINAIQIGWNQD